MLFLDSVPTPPAVKHGVTIPPPLIRREVIEDLKASAERLLPAQMAAVVHRTQQPLLQAIFDLESPQVVFGRVASSAMLPSLPDRMSPPASPRPPWTLNRLSTHSRRRLAISMAPWRTTVTSSATSAAGLLRALACSGR